MVLRLSSLSRVTHLCALAGVAAGLGTAVRQIAPQQYLSHGLWRTALWTASHDTMLGAALGAGAGLAMVLSLSRHSSCLPVARVAALSFAVSGAGAVLLMPMEAPDVLGLPYPAVAGVCLALVWVAVRAGAAALLGERDRDQSLDWFRLLWPLLLGMGYVTVLSRLWARQQGGWIAVCLAGAGSLAGIGIYTTLYRPLERLAAPVGRFTEGRGRPGWARWTGVGLSAVILALWLGAGVVGLGTGARTRSAGISVILIAVDTLREDGVSLLSADQHGRDLTPKLRAMLAPRSTIFTNAISQAPWTLPAFASMFTGLYPEEHGAEHFTSRLLSEELTLAEVLRDAGYSTMAVVSGHYVTSEVGMAQGFTIFDQSQALGGMAVTSAQVTDRALTLLRAHRDRPFFLFVHYFDPHYIYQDHREFTFLPNDLALTGPGNAPAVVRSYAGRPVGPAEQASLRAYYDEEIAYTDLHIGRLLAYLEESQLWDSTCVIFVSDHGEEFLDHGSTGHDNTLFQELIHVPLAIADPSRKAAGIVAEPVETRWIFRTILDVAGISPPGEAAQVRSVFAGPGDEPVPLRSSTYPWLPQTEGQSRALDVWLSCLIQDGHKLIKDHTTGETKLFDLENDAGETRDLSGSKAQRASELHAALDAWDGELQGRATSRPMPRLTEQELQRLRSLGYL